MNNTQKDWQKLERTLKSKTMEAPESLKEKSYAQALEGIDESREHHGRNKSRRRRKHLLIGLGGGSVVTAAVVATVMLVASPYALVNQTHHQLERSPAYETELPSLGYGLSDRPEERETEVVQEGISEEVIQKLVDDENLPFSFYVREDAQVEIETEHADAEVKIEAPPVEIYVLGQDSDFDFDAYVNEIDDPVESYSDDPFSGIGGEVQDYEDFELGYAYFIEYGEYDLVITSLANSIEAVEGRIYSEEQITESWEWKTSADD